VEQEVPRPGEMKLALPTDYASPITERRCYGAITPRSELATACRSLVPEGMCESAGNHFQSKELPLFEMYLNSVNLRIARDNVRATIPPALRLAQSGRVDPMQVVSHVLDWETLPDALPELHTKPVFVRDPVELPQVAR
jgi:hypothetical protein